MQRARHRRSALALCFLNFPLLRGTRSLARITHAAAKQSGKLRKRATLSGRCCYSALPKFFFAPEREMCMCTYIMCVCLTGGALITFAARRKRIEILCATPHRHCRRAQIDICKLNHAERNLLCLSVLSFCVKTSMREVLRNENLC